MTNRVPGLGLGFGASIMLHVALITAIFMVRSAPPLSPPRIFRVILKAAPQGEPGIGVTAAKAPPVAPKIVPPLPPAVVRPDRTAPVPTANPTPAPPPPAPRQVTTTATPPVSVPKPTAPLPAAGSVAGGKGADVLNMLQPGVDFPYPAYLQGLPTRSRRVSRPVTGSLVATLQFTIHRDGSVHDIQFVSHSGDYTFDTEAHGAIDGAGSTKAFGPLPADFHDDALNIFFTFSPPKPPNL